MKLEHVLREKGVPATHELVRERNLAEGPGAGGGAALRAPPRG